MTIYLEDGFESGDFSAWDEDLDIQITTNSDYVHTGTYAAIEDGNTAYVGTHVTDDKPFVYCKFWFKIYSDTLEDTWYDTLAETYEQTDLFLIRLYIYKDGSDMKLQTQIRHQTGGGGGDTTTTLDTEVLNLNEWYCVEYLCFAGTGGVDKVWLDGREVASVTCVYAGYTMDHSYIYAVGWNYDFCLRAIDDCVYSDVYNGCCPDIDVPSLGGIAIEHVLGWEEEASSVIAKKKVISRCCPTPAPEEAFIVSPRIIVITVRVSTTEKGDIESLYNDCEQKVLCDSGAIFIDYVWMEKPLFRWDSELGCGDKPWIAILTLVCYNT